MGHPDRLLDTVRRSGVMVSRISARPRASQAVQLRGGGLATLGHEGVQAADGFGHALGCIHVPKRLLGQHSVEHLRRLDHISQAGLEAGKAACALALDAPE